MCGTSFHLSCKDSACVCYYFFVVPCLPLFSLLLRVACYMVLHPFISKFFISKMFSQIFFESIEISLIVDRNICEGKIAYIWISLEPVQVGPTLGRVVVVSSAITQEKIANAIQMEKSPTSPPGVLNFSKRHLFAPLRARIDATRINFISYHFRSISPGTLS